MPSSRHTVEAERMKMALRRFEADCGDDEVKLAALEQEYERLCRELGDPPFLLEQRNAFRVAHAWAMNIKRPHVLYGRHLIEESNFQSMPMLQYADVSFLSLYGGRSDRGDVVSVDITTQDFGAVLKALPRGFRPDVYFDFQVCSSQTFIRGLETAPFPSVASLCHMFEAMKIERICGLFDYVLPLSRRFSELLATRIPRQKLIDLPFGLSWGSFEHMFLPPKAARDIDVLLSFDGAGDSTYGPYRKIVCDLFERAQARFGRRYRFVKATGIDKDDYLALLQRSRIVLNAVGVHGPYNYRTCEAISAGATLMQYDARYVTGPQGIEDYYTPDEDIVLFDASSFEAKLEALLADPSSTAAIAARADARQRAQYSYRALYDRLFDIVLNDDEAKRLARRTAAHDAARTRLEVYLDCKGVPYLPVSFDDLVDVLNASEVPPLALLMALYPGLQPELQERFRRMLIGPDTPAIDAAAADLAFYDATMAAIEAPSPVDWFNHAFLCAARGRIDADAVRGIVEMLRAPALSLDDRAMVRVCRRDIPPETAPAAVRQAELRVLNMGWLMAGADTVRRQAAVRDYMLIRLYGFLAQAEGGCWTRDADDILARYPLAVEDSAAERLPLAS